MELSGAERLILVMLSEIHEHLKIKGGVDPKFVQNAIHSGNTWGLAWQYPGIFESSERTPPHVKEVVDILDMWSQIEFAYSRLSAADKKRVEAEAGVFGKNPTFRGFDGNNETTHMGVAQFLINELGRFESLKKRPMNSHMPSLDTYDRMYRAYEPMRKTLTDGRLSADQIIQILKAQEYPRE